MYVNNAGNLPQYGFGWTILRGDLIKHFNLKKSMAIEAVMQAAVNDLSERYYAMGFDKLLYVGSFPTFIPSRLTDFI